MQGKAVALGLIIGVIVGLPMGYLASQVFPDLQLMTNTNSPHTQATPNPYAGYTQIKVNVASQDTIHTFEGIKYVFIYIPTYLDFLGNKVNGSVKVYSELDIIGKSIPLTTSIEHNYYRIQIIVTQIQSEYVTLMIKPINP